MGVTHFFSSPSVKKEWEGLFLKYLLIFFFDFFPRINRPGSFVFSFDPRIFCPGVVRASRTQNRSKLGTGTCF